MIRDRLKRVARKAAIKVFNMEFDTEERDPNAHRRGDPSKFDPSKIPKIVDGAGDTPGPNHKENIGRPSMSAQVAGGVTPFCIDLRAPIETLTGVLPGAIVLPRELVKQRRELLPEKSARITVYDQTGAQESTEVAAWLRAEGWTMARRLQGGFAEWLEHGEQVSMPVAPDGGKHRIGDPVSLADGRAGWVVASTVDKGTPRVTVWHEDGTTTGPLNVDDLAS
jgi:rhodanese-related sulfurtransferase